MNLTNKIVFWWTVSLHKSWWDTNVVEIFEYWMKIGFHGNRFNGNGYDILALNLNCKYSDYM